MEQDKQFACESKPVEEQAVSSLWMEELFSTLSDEEQQIIYHLYFLEKSEREVCAAMNLVLSTFRRRKRALLEKLLSDFISGTFVADGMCADVAIHDPHPLGHNPHAHILLSWTLP